MAPTEVRIACDEDDAPIAAIHNSCEPGGPPTTPERVRADRASTTVWVSEGGEVAGYVKVCRAWWTGIADSQSLELKVAPTFRRRGHGSRLLEVAQSQGVGEVLLWVRDEPESLAFGQRRGFAPTGQVVQDYTLDLSTFQGREPTSVAQILDAEQLDLDDDETIRGLQRAWSPEGTAADPGSWRKTVLDGAAKLFVALDRGVPVGATLVRDLGEGALDNDFTGVVPEFRRRGIATSLKLAAIAWAQNAGARTFHTSSLLDNAPMIAVHRKLGYRPGVLRRELRLPPRG